ncbi:hypothetical protein HanIR_Chr16g0820511 [Helianthus annuus]|nr:hypothetical protein HanIR_Chr16g0820511 [Helianthus annuus]
MSVNLAFFWMVKISWTCELVATRRAETRARTQTTDLKINSASLTFRPTSFTSVPI